MQPRILFVEDEPSISDPFAKALTRAGFDTVTARTGREALALARRIDPDLVLLDLNLPDTDGRDVARELRRQGDTPILMLTARGTEMDRIVGLELGADDYVVKPFSGPEVIARIRAVLRRVNRSAPIAAAEPVEIGALGVDFRARRATLDGSELQLSRKEFDLLAELARNAGVVVSREELMDRVWDENWFGSTKTLDTHVGLLRRKLGDEPGAPRYLRTVRGRVPVQLARGDGPVSLRGSLLLALAYVLLLALIAFAVPLAVSLRDRQDEEVRLQSRGQADVVAATAAPLLAPRSRARLNRLAGTASRSVRGRVLILDSSGKVLADSAGRGQVGATYSRRPEIAAALRGRRYQGSRHSATLNEDLLATAAPVLRGGRVTGAVRITQSVAAVHRAVRRSIAGLALIAGVVLMLGMAAGWLIARRLALPLRRLEATAGEIAHGDLDRRAPVDGTLEQRSLARSFNAMTVRLSRALRAQQEFVADASHQLRTPLTGLRLQLEEAEASTNGGAPVRAELDAALGEVDRLSQMVNELLLLSSAGGRDAPAEEVELTESARAAAARWRATAADRGIALTHANGAAQRVTAARVDLDRALDALVENALRYSPPGSAVEIEVHPGRVQVLDGGPGLAPGEDEQVFERFHRGRAGRGGPAGTGLGLPIARELMRRWDARVWLENRTESGARAVIAFDSAESGARR